MFPDCSADILKESNLEEATMLEVILPLKTSFYSSCRYGSVLDQASFMQKVSELITFFFFGVCAKNYITYIHTSFLMFFLLYHYTSISHGSALGLSRPVTSSSHTHNSMFVGTVRVSQSLTGFVPIVFQYCFGFFVGLRQKWRPRVQLCSQWQSVS